MRAILAISVPIMWMMVVLWSAVEQGEKIKAVMHGTDFSTDPKFIVVLFVTIVITVLAIALHKD